MPRSGGEKETQTLVVNRNTEKNRREVNRDDLSNDMATLPYYSSK